MHPRPLVMCSLRLVTYNFPLGEGGGLRVEYEEDRINAHTNSGVLEFLVLTPHSGRCTQLMNLNAKAIVRCVNPHKLYLVCKGFLVLFVCVCVCVCDCVCVCVCVCV